MFSPLSVPLAVFANREDFVRNKAMSLTVDGVGVFGAVGFDKTEDFPLFLVDPVPEITHLIPVLGFEVLHMCTSNIRSGNPALNGVDIHEK
jgi:hypothetical protein